MPGDNFFYYIRDWLLAEPGLVDLFQTEGREYVPFFPAQQFPESEVPYVRYTTTQSVSSDTPWWHTGEAFMSVWFTEIDDAQEAINIIVDMCSYADESAGELERWLSANNIDAPYHYHSIEVPNVGEVDTTEERGGAHAMALMIRVQFSPKSVRDRYSVNS